MTLLAEVVQTAGTRWAIERRFDVPQGEGACITSRSGIGRGGFWQFVLATTQSIGQILDWSVWRRCYQGRAQFCHDKRRADPEVSFEY